MLKVEWISQIKVEKDNYTYKNEWKRERLAKFTSSMNYVLMGEKPFTQGAMTYIYERVGEELSGIPCKTEVETEGTRWGLLNEADGTRKLGEFLGVTFLATQTLITAPGSRTGSTPDAIWPIQKYTDGWDVETGEVKCYPSYGRYIACALCNTPQDVKKVDFKAYVQVLDQMDNCDCMRGNLCYYHPDMKAGNFKVIKFKKIELMDDFKLLKQRKALAIDKFYEVLDKMMNLHAKPVLQ